MQKLIFIYAIVDKQNYELFIFVQAKTQMSFLLWRIKFWVLVVINRLCNIIQLSK